MHAEDIKAAIRKAGCTQAEIARALKVSRMAVGHVVANHGKSRRIAQRIATVTGIPVAKLWPGKYPDLEHVQRIPEQQRKAFEAEVRGGMVAIPGALEPRRRTKRA